MFYSYKLYIWLKLLVDHLCMCACMRVCKRTTRVSWLHPSVMSRLLWLIAVWQLTADGQATVTLSTKDLQALVYSDPGYTADPMSTLTYSTLYVEANVTETLTQVTLTGNSTVRLTNNKYQLEVMDITPDSFKPHLVFYGFVSALVHVGKLVFFNQNCISYFADCYLCCYWFIIYFLRSCLKSI